MDTSSSVPSVPSDVLNRRVLLGAAGLAGAAVLGSFASRAQAGPLDPPSGPISSTSKPLADVEPRIAINATNTPPYPGYLFRITQPGSYYLTGNLVVPAGVSGIQAFTPATIDLNGFSISGAPGVYGIVTANGATIRNGSISNFVYGINSTFDTLVEGVTFDTFTTRAIIAGGRCTFRRCVFRGTNPVALECNSDYATVEDCHFVGGGVQGAYLNSYTTLRHCRFIGSSIGAYIGYGSRAERCTFDACTTRGLQTAARVFIDGCTVTGTSAAGSIGFEVADGCTIVRSAASGNPIGIQASTASRISDCSLDSNTTGVKLIGSGAVVEACTFTRNSTAVDMSNVSGNYVYKCVMLGNTATIAVNIGGNWYPSVALGGVNTATNPLASTFG